MPRSTVTALSSESLRSNSPPEDPRRPGGRAGLKIDVVFLMLNLSYVVNSTFSNVSVLMCKTIYLQDKKINV